MFFFIKLCTDEEYPLFLWREREEGREGRDGGTEGGRERGRVG